MKAEYNHQYKCQKGQMPEDFENIVSYSHNITAYVIVYLRNGGKDLCMRKTEHGKWIWLVLHTYEPYGYDDDEVLAWMFPEPYKYGRGGKTMIAEYYKRYKCEKGTMPEDFENCLEPANPYETKYVVLWYDDVPPTYIETDYRIKSPSRGWVWRNAHNHQGCVAWMLPEPYKE